MSGPKVVLVHGAWGNPNMWSLVQPRLEANGLRVQCADLPTSQDPASTLATDVDHVRSLVASEPTVLVGHSYGGAVVTEASGGESAIKHLVYIAAQVPDAGESTFDIMQRRPMDAFHLDFFEDGTSLPKQWGADDGRYPDDVLPLFVANPPRRQAVASALEPITQPGWKTIASTYIVAARDQVVHPDTQRELAEERADRTVEADCDHLAIWVEPETVADVITDAALSAAD